jgi:sec-independent protein translocase protein TatB
MFDVGFSELVVIALVALIVIGPERLPRVARTLGALLGRAQRYVNDVKADIQREVDLDELKSIRSTFQDAAKSVEQSMTQVGQELQAAGESLNQSISGTQEDKVGSTAAQSPAAAESATHGISGTADNPAGTSATQPAAAVAADESQTASAQMDLGLESKPAAELTAPKARA